MKGLWEARGLREQYTDDATLGGDASDVLAGSAK